MGTQIEMARSVAISLLAVCATAAHLNSTGPLDIVTQGVSIDGVPENRQGKCYNFLPGAITSTGRPVIKVCGTDVKLTAYLRNRCQDYHPSSSDPYKLVVGVCDTKKAAGSCDQQSPETVQWLARAQSWKITSCSEET